MIISCFNYIPFLVFLPKLDDQLLKNFTSQSYYENAEVGRMHNNAGLLQNYYG